MALTSSRVRGAAYKINFFFPAKESWDGFQKSLDSGLTESSAPPPQPLTFVWKGLAKANFLRNEILSFFSCFTMNS